MANTIPVDSNRIVLIALSGARPMPARVELSDGTTRIDPNGAQATHKVTGERMWQIDAAMAADAADERGRAVNMTVKVATNDRPIVTPGMPVRFVDLAVLTYNDQQSGRATLSWSATGVEPAAAAGRKHDQAA